MMIKILSLLALVFIFFACTESENFIPKPPTYLRLNLPEREYTTFDDSCSFKFELPSYASVKSTDKSSCNKDINLGEFNGTVHLSYIEIDTNLSSYVNYAIDKVEEHKIKATAIKDTNIINSDHDVYGTFFSLEGNVASPFQFYVTDSTDVFLSGIVYFNSIPNYDSIKPVLQYVKKDLIHLLETTEWQF